MSSTCRVQPWRWCGADREQFWVKILFQNCQHCNSVMSEINWNPWMEFFPGRTSAGIKVIHVCRHNTPWCLMRELVTESTTVATAPVVYYPMFSQQSIISNWVGAAGHNRERERPVPVDDWIERLHFLLGRLAQPVFASKVHLTTVQLRSDQYLSLCFHSCVHNCTHCTYDALECSCKKINIS